MIPRHLSVLFVIVATLWLTACGYQLRGNGELPEILARTHVQNAGGGYFWERFDQSLETAGYRRVGDPAEATVKMRVLEQGFDRRAVTIGGDAEVREYEITGRLVMEVSRPGAEPETMDLEASRVYEYDPANVLAQNQEQSAIREEIDEALLRQLLYRLEALER